MATTDLLAPLALFRDLSPEERATIFNLMTRRSVTRGESIVEQGQPSEAIFIVLHGAFEVVRDGIDSPIASLRSGDVIGEIGFFAGDPRTATARATRDATVLEMDRAAYQRAVEQVPALASAMLTALARRLDATSSLLSPPGLPRGVRTIAIVHGGVEPIPDAFFERLRQALDEAGARVIDHEAVKARSTDEHEISEWLNALEWDCGLVVYLADADLTDWTRKCVRQADMVMVVTRGEAPRAELTPTEAFVCEVHEPRSRRLVRAHDERAGVVSGTTAWLERIDVFMHHHVALADMPSFCSLVRFMTGRAIGFVAAGGGAFGPAHAGIFKAFVERGVHFDAFIGTSVGSAMMAGAAMGRDAENMDDETHTIFVTRRAFKRPGWPRYALLDHKVFDEALAETFGATTRIEDCWHPYFAVATNLSTQSLEVIRTGLVWKAVRASCAIPAVLPPMYTEDGSMLVDGGLMDNIPLRPLQGFKTGPNLVVHFGHEGDQRFDVQYDDIPGRWELLNAMFNPLSRQRAPRAPRAASVLMRSLFVRGPSELPVGPEDLVLRPPNFPGSSFLDFDRHTSVFHASYEWACETLDALTQSGDPALAAILPPATKVETAPAPRVAAEARV